jgi:hypothetical protein
MRKWPLSVNQASGRVTRYKTNTMQPILLDSSKATAHAMQKPLRIHGKQPICITLLSDNYDHVLDSRLVDTFGKNHLYPLPKPTEIFPFHKNGDQL